MTAGAWRGAGVLCLWGGVVVGLLGAARLERVGSAWQSRPVWPVFLLGIVLLGAGALLLQLHRRHSFHAAAGAGGTAALLSELRAAVAALQAGRAVGHEAGMPAALEALAEAAAPTEDAPYLLWLKLQLDPLLDDLYPRLLSTRESFRKRSGVQAYGALFSGLARAERLLARAWSAAVDGYAEEARAALRAAARQLAELPPEGG